MRHKTNFGKPTGAMAKAKKPLEAPPPPPPTTTGKRSKGVVSPDPAPGG